MTREDKIDAAIIGTFCGSLFIFFVTYGVLQLWRFPICTIILISWFGIALGIGIFCVVTNPDKLGW